MAIHVYAYAPSASEQEKIAREEQLFRDNLQLLLARANEILSQPEYFFCPLSFAWCSLLWLDCDGPLSLGQLQLGWEDGILLEPCPDCRSTVVVTSFGGSVCSGANGWSGFCVECRSKKSNRHSVNKPFFKRATFVSAVRRQFPETRSYWEEFDGQTFSWGGNGFQTGKRKRLVVKNTYDSGTHAMNLELLIEELKSSNGRKGNPPPCRE